MKKLLLLFVLATFTFNCSTESDDTPILEENTIIGRWHIVSLEQTSMYVFTENLRHTIYSTDGNFGGLETAIPNPNTWTFEGEELVVDLNFGNFLRTNLNFKCDGNVVEFIDAEGTVGTILFREGYDYASCNQ
ncbi:MAG: hypothetical protein EVB11_05790 [Winogradskyella sp.]|nr:MAG: hypothetical protein EVB11_05790 [Winogradskyella sp.]